MRRPGETSGRERIGLRPMDQKRYAHKPIFVTVQSGVAEVDLDTVPEGIKVEVIDLDDLKVDPSAVNKLSRGAKTYARRRGFL